MLTPFSTVLATACLVLQSLASPTSGKQLYPISKRQVSGAPAVPIPPLQDPWYTAPAGFDATKPGDVLRIRGAPGNLTALAGNCSAAYNILYRTTNSQYKPDWAVTTVFVPVTPFPALLSYQIEYDSAWLDASPSYALYSIDSARYLLDIATGLSSGWFVNVPDYEGPLASFTAGVTSGHATIDSVRAVFNARDTLGLDANARSAMWGYSGGALASEWAAELAVQYAPEMNFSGAALGGLTPNVTEVLYSVNKGYAAGLASSAILGISSQYPEEREFLVSRLRTEGPYRATRFLAALNYTLYQSALAYDFQDIGEYFTGGLADLTSPTVLNIINRDGVMGYHGVPQMPIFAYKAIQDEISAVEDTDALVAKYCAAGVNILYQRNTIGGHAQETANGRASALAWLSSVLGGTYAEIYPYSGCSTETVTLDFISAAVSGGSLLDKQYWSWIPRHSTLV